MDRALERHGTMSGRASHKRTANGCPFCALNGWGPAPAAVFDDNLAKGHHRARGAFELLQRRRFLQNRLLTLEL